MENQGPATDNRHAFLVWVGSRPLPANAPDPVMPLPEIILIRHGQTHWNREGRIQGHGDSTLTPLGEAQARAYGRLLADRFPPLDRFALHRSPAGRCSRTARLLSEASGLDFNLFSVEYRLKEKGYGHWEGMTRPEIAAAGQADGLAEMDADPWDHRPPGGGESLADVMARAGAWLRGLDPVVPVIAVAHGGTGRTLIRAALGLDVAETLAIQMRQDVIFRIADGNLEILETELDFS